MNNMKLIFTTSLVLLLAACGSDSNDIVDDRSETHIVSTESTKVGKITILFGDRNAFICKRMHEVLSLIQNGKDSAHSEFHYSDIGSDPNLIRAYYPEKNSSSASEQNYLLCTDTLVGSDGYNHCSLSGISRNGCYEVYGSEQSLEKFNELLKLVKEQEIEVYPEK